MHSGILFRPLASAMPRVSRRLALGLGALAAVAPIVAAAASGRWFAVFGAGADAPVQAAAFAIGWVPLLFLPVLPR